MAKKQKLFKRGAWLYTFEKALTEKQFIEKAGGEKALESFMQFPFVSLVLDKEKSMLVGHLNGRTISLIMQSHGHQQWQTMEWK